MEMINGVPRRNRIDLNTPAELAIYNAMGEVEKCGASENLTKAVTLLQDAKDALADHIEGLPPSEEKKEEAKVFILFTPTEESLKYMKDSFNEMNKVLDEIKDNIDAND
jgi:hypothetical protein